MSKVFRSSIILAFFFSIDKIMGLLRQVLIARQFGLSYDIDVFNAANNIPDLLSALISGGALGVALIPVLSEFLEKKGRKDAWELFSHILNLAFIVTGILALLIIVAARPMVDIVIAPGFPPEQKALTVELMRLDLLAILIFSISGLVMAALQANQHFLFPAMAPVLYNLGQIFGILILAPQVGRTIGPITLPGFGFGIRGLVFGVILGALLHLSIQIPALIKYQFRWSFNREDLNNALRIVGSLAIVLVIGSGIVWLVNLGLQAGFASLSQSNIASIFGCQLTLLIRVTPILDIVCAVGVFLLLWLGIAPLFRTGQLTMFRGAGVEQVIRLLGPRVLTMLFIQTYFVSRDNLASGLGEGSISALNYGWFIMQVPETLIGTAIAIVILPTISEFIARGETDNFKTTLNRAFRVMIALTIPIAAILAMGLRPIVGILGFDAAGTTRVVLATQAYLIGLVGHSLLEIASRSFYAQQNARTPLYAAFLMMVLFLGFAVIYTCMWGFVGIALANVTAFTLEALLLLFLLNRKLPGVINVWSTIPRVLIASLLGAAVVFAIITWAPFHPSGRLLEALFGIVAMAIGGLVAVPFIIKEVKMLVKL